jgi:hypothetical protein
LAGPVNYPGGPVIGDGVDLTIDTEPILGQ